MILTKLFVEIDDFMKIHEKNFNMKLIENKKRNANEIQNSL